ncbi:MAG: hypothetical protein LBE08_13700 [Bifidobacteriaceae bacterium]|nr:hypothetical protein [Bifidobacteriaceae bacterium]
MLRPLRLALAIAWLPLVAGCGPSGNDVASIGSPSPSPTPTLAADQAAAAEAVASCLRQDGISAEVFTLDGGTPHIGLAGGHDWLARYPNGEEEESLSPDGSLIDAEQVKAFYDSGDKPVRLVVDGKDQSESWVRCLEDSGFAGPAPVQDGPAEEIRRRQIQADVTNEWAACARENGLPALEDVMPGAVGSPFPTLTVPLATSPAILRDVLAICPLTDDDAEAAANVAISEPDPESEDEQQRFAALSSVLDEVLLGDAVIEH